MKLNPRPFAAVIGVVTILICLAVPALAMADSSRSKASASKKSAVTARKTVVPADEILRRSSAYFANPPYLLAEEVYGKIVQGGDNSFFLVSLQSRDGFAKGHVPGAVNIPFSEITEPTALKLLPRSRKIVLTCDDGHRSMAAALYFAQLGYNVATMPMGLNRWNAVASGIASPYADSAGYPVATEPVEATSKHTLPVFTSTARNGRKLITERTRKVLASGRSLFIDRNEVYERVIKGGDDRYVLVSIQRPEDYAKGHVPGAINIPYNELAKPGSLRKLPGDKKIVVICYIGHMAGAASLFLNQLGFEAYDMRFGTLGWNDTTAGLGSAKDFLVGLGKTLNYPVAGNLEKTGN